MGLRGGGPAMGPRRRRGSPRPVDQCKWNNPRLAQGRVAVHGPPPDPLFLREDWAEDVHVAQHRHAAQSARGLPCVPQRPPARDVGIGGHHPKVCAPPRAGELPQEVALHRPLPRTPFYPLPPPEPSIAGPLPSHTAHPLTVCRLPPTHAGLTPSHQHHRACVLLVRPPPPAMHWKGGRPPPPGPQPMPSPCPPDAKRQPHWCL